MCLGVPMKVIEINYPAGVAEAKGVKREIGLQLIPENEISLNDHVIVHVGFAIEKIDSKLADEIWDTLDEILLAIDKSERLDSEEEENA
ncbi:MAG: HypC/HybG/HupF family hydrogenase formation chaperone [Nitrospirota bacterium]